MHPRDMNSHVVELPLPTRIIAAWLSLLEAVRPLGRKGEPHRVPELAGAVAAVGEVVVVAGARGGVDRDCRGADSLMGRVVEVAPDPSRCTIVSLVALLQLYATVVLVARSSAPGISQAQKLVPSMSRLRPKWKGSS